jgi:hypothetical protein
MNEFKPKIVILMDNLPILLYKEYQSSLPDTAPVIPSIAFLAIYMDQTIKGMKNSIGVRYEIPVVASIANLRFLLDHPFKKVGVVHRAFMDSLIILNQEYCLKENIQLIPYSIPDEEKFWGFGGNLRKSLQKLCNKENVDALWVLNDNALLTPDLIKDVWQPLLKSYRIPVIVGVEALVNPKLRFGSYAVLPDHNALYRQVADVAYRIKDNNWEVPSSTIQQPVTVNDIANFTWLAKYNIPKNKLTKIGKIIK